MNNQTKQIFFCLGLLLLAGVLSSCGSETVVEPTLDVNMLSTNAVQTVEANFTQTALAMPTSTPTPVPTYTPIAATPTMAAAVSILPTAGAANTGIINTAATTVPTVAQVVQSVVAGAPTATLATAGDKAVYASQSVADGTHYSPGAIFDLTYYFTNSGTTTWSTSYSLRFFGHTNFAKSGNNRYYLPANVAPGETGSVTIDCVAPTSPGSYTMAWVLSNANDENFSIVDITIIVD